ncbi:PREDICTED: histone H2A.Z-specific chaperone CHZ1 [Fragaria vesca subsp. vesca]|uniref:histone H2A.Z-specific chaperone CHZ1 n=1 Tax=Fragaria vesca subsp. vesca TaxID=101020 RepID=UPI0002C36A79|nr:PREDICTED: histone H2A.Z-specific chaperone CHZ1 [Fragaria vesca subsp. vesca]
MAETKDQDETTLHAKRKSDPSCEEDQADYPNKSQKLQLTGNNSHESSLTQDNKVELQGNADPQVEDEDDEEEYEEEDGEESNGKSEADRKGKGVMRDDKGKGILIEEDDENEDSSDDSSSSSSEGGSEFEDGDSDLSDDPLAEVDLDNILPSRTRRRQVQPGVYIRSDNNGKSNNDDSDDSDD